MDAKKKKMLIFETTEQSRDTSCNNNLTIRDENFTKKKKQKLLQLLI